MTRIEIHPWRIETIGPVTDFTESVFAIGNGWLGARGFSTQVPKASPQDHALFRAGFFEPVKPGITDMVQLPDALGLRVKGYAPTEVRQLLDMRRGILAHAWEAGGLAVATERMVKEAEDMGADAVIAVRFATSSIMQSAAEVMAYGTAVKFK